MSGPQAAAAASSPAAGQATRVGALASSAASEQPAVYAAPAVPTPDAPRSSSGGTVGATRVGASARRPPLVDPELDRRSGSRAVSLPPGFNYSAQLNQGDIARLVPTLDVNYDDRTQTSLAARNGSIAPMPIWSLDMKDKSQVHYSNRGFLKLLLPKTNFSAKI